MAKTKPDPWPSFDRCCHNIERSLNYKGESNFSCLQGLSVDFCTRWRKSLRRLTFSSSVCCGKDPWSAETVTDRINGPTQTIFYVCLLGFTPGVSAPVPVGPSTYVRQIFLCRAYARWIWSSLNVWDQKSQYKNTHRLLIFDKGTQGSCGFTPWLIGHKEKSSALFPYRDIFS